MSNSYVIFICDFDPFNGGKYRYTIHNGCVELGNENVEDGNTTIFLSTKGTNKEEVPSTLVKFLNFVRADLEESIENFEDDFVKSLQDSVASIKKSREMEERFMLLELMLQDERTEGKAESIIELLEVLGEVSEELQETIMKQKNRNILSIWLKLAAKADSIEQFVNEM